MPVIIGLVVTLLWLGWVGLLCSCVRIVHLRRRSRNGCGELGSCIRGRLRLGRVGFGGIGGGFWGCGGIFGWMGVIAFGLVLWILNNTLGESEELLINLTYINSPTLIFS